MSKADVGDARTELLAGLERAGSGPSPQVAVLWTWLEKHLNVLGSFDDADTLILEQAVAQCETFDGPTEDDLELIARQPAYGAATLLARIAARQAHLKRPASVALERGIDDEDVLVRWRNEFLHGEMVGAGKDDGPPAAKQAPSLAAIAPGLHVCPLRVGVISFVAEIPHGSAWEAAAQRLQGALDAKQLTIHLDPLVNSAAGQEEDPTRALSPPLLAGSTGWEFRNGHALLLDEKINQADHTRCQEVAREAVRQASGSPSVLVLPELVATAQVVEALADELDRQDDPPALTVVGLRHRPGQATGLDPSAVGETALAGYVNEAVVLGPDGGELWRHRKLTRAGGNPDDDLDDPDDPDDDKRYVQERISVGDTITIIDTPIGTVAVSICLDVFTDHVRERLAESPIELLLVPSLSPHVHRHRTALAQVAQGTWGLAFVCNRGLQPDQQRPTGWKEHDNQSFWVRSGSEPIRPAPPHPQQHQSFVVRLPPGESEQE
jgi:predicted amidohydrolase